MFHSGYAGSVKRKIGGGSPHALQSSISKRSSNYSVPRNVVGSSRFNRKNSVRGLNRRGVVDKETGFVDTAVANYAYDTTGSITLINTVAQGTTVNQRVGKKIVMKSLLMRGFHLNGSTASYNDCVYLVVYDKRPTGSLPAITDILNTINSSSMNNDANSGRFVILKRGSIVLQGLPSTTTGINFAENADMYLDLRNLPVSYKLGTTGAIGDQEMGSLLFVTCGNTGAGTSAAQITVGFRLRFLDV